jgi:hypothetical protein
MLLGKCMGISYIGSIFMFTGTRKNICKTFKGIVKKVNALW